MERADVQRIKRLQKELSRIQHKLNELVLKAASRKGKLSLDDLEISVSRLGTAVGKGAMASRRPLVQASRRPVDLASRRPLDMG